jgi:hypothetical protein
MHPVFGLWPVTLAPDLEASLMAGERKVSEWVRQNQAREVMFPPLEIGGRTIDPFFNVNRPDELDAAEAFLQASAVCSAIPDRTRLDAWSDASAACVRCGTRRRQPTLGVHALRRRHCLILRSTLRRRSVR